MIWFKWRFSIIVAVVRYLFTSSGAIQKYILNKFVNGLSQVFQSERPHNQLVMARDLYGEIILIIKVETQYAIPISSSLNRIA